MGRRKTWAQRTRANTAAAKKLAKAFNEKPVIEVREFGEEWRVWDRSHVATNDEVRKAIMRQRAIEECDLSLELPPSAIKDAVTRKWLLRVGSLLMVTEKARDDLKLPRQTGSGMTIKFAKVPA